MAKVGIAAAAAIVSLALLGCRGSDPANDDAGCGIGTCEPLDCSGDWCTWTGALAFACPRNAWSVSRCAGFFRISLQGVDTSSVHYYSADSGELVWSCGINGCKCSGPNLPPCNLFATCMKDDSLCAALEGATTGDAGDASIEAASSTAGDASAE
jgi:hypothetical protein